ncbi:SusD/RagB family nutrient-binding outer membrane lipoprotein [Chitinophaga qingshengii]|uniref:SusD/RagB family nutrient-binding outer membrane lipoprotein n=1 Tax=Chitinophaga qingshengii TaxID=1569794 RepID=A0ABR7TNZ9_9BACT|nr:SusD/RagB family nutrient-binding outer membrane lipoprotein [Chitinophaga qingshengii]MBC9931360.1 SusD/RagB family nutrient-binding outer membrane lipoprotein [Chitinophaga qingshengii]
MKRLSSIILIALVVVTGCTKGFLDINKDPNNPAKGSLPLLLTGAEQGLSYDLGFTNAARGALGLTEVLSVYTHQIVVREDPDQYGSTGIDVNINGAWASFYAAQPVSGLPDYIGMMENVEQLIAQANTGGFQHYAGIGKILKAYAYSQFVDAFADLPYLEANQFGPNGLRYPKFDKGADIYPKLFALIDEGITNLQSTAVTVQEPNKDDLFYGGDIPSWLRMAKSLKLKLYNQVRLVQDVSGPVNQLVSAGGLISQTKEGFMMKYGSQVAPDDRNPGFSEYYATQKSHYISPWFYEIMKGYNPRLFTGIKDPRIPYYFYNQNSKTGASQNPTEYRDSAFISIYFGSTSSFRNASQDNSMTVFGIYPVGGRYDIGDATVVKAGSGTGAAPLRLLTYADVLYIEAELMNAGILPGNARQKLSDAIDESFKQVDFVSGLAKGNQNVPLIVGTAATDYRDKILAVYDARATAKDKLEVIMTQKWIQTFGFSCDSYTDYRRTGFPILFNPNDPTMAPGGFAQPPLLGNPTLPPPQAKISVALGRSYPLSLPWPNNEIEVNPNAPAQKQPAATPVFWQK